MALVRECDFEAVVTVVEQKVDRVQNEVSYHVLHRLETLQSTYHDITHLLIRTVVYSTSKSHSILPLLNYRK